MKRLLILLSSLALASSSFAAKPNILFLLSNDHSYPFLSCYGDKNVKTPTLDQVAAVPSELNNLSGKPALAAAERSLRLALTEKIILDFDYLPLPDFMDGGAGSKAKGNGKKKAE